MSRQYFTVNLTGKPRAYAKYRKLESVIIAGIAWLRGEALAADAERLEHWMRSPGGFTRPHTPYYVILSAGDWSILSRGLRRGHHNTTAEYAWVRSIGTWEI